MDERIVNRIVWGAAIIAVAMFIGATFIGCSESTAPTAAWQSEYDAPWAAVVECYGYEPAKPIVAVKDDCINDSYYPAAYSSTGYAAGEFSRPNRVTVCGDLAGLEHEFSEYVYFRINGHYGTNYSGVCWL